LRHPDGTYGVYLHLKKDSEMVNVGDEVDVGEPIAKSGNTGQSSGPHLHFHVNKADGQGNWQTVSWKFEGTDVKINGQDAPETFVPETDRKYKKLSS
jgi:murein DD-endopeptidase MepM/ murein hydrolase activator NlpD